MEKQNRMLKTVLLLLMIPVIAGTAIAAFYFGQKLFNADDRAAKDNNLPTVKRDDPFSGNSTATATATASPTPAATASPTPSPTAAPKPSVEQSSFPLIGRWAETTGQGKIIMKFEAPKKIGNAEIGRVITAAEFGKEYESVYEVVSSNQYRLKDEQTDYYYVIEAGGKSLKLTNDGQTRYLTRIK